LVDNGYYYMVDDHRLNQADMLYHLQPYSTVKW